MQKPNQQGKPKPNANNQATQLVVWQQKPAAKQRKPRPPRPSSFPQNREQIGNVVRSALTRLGIGDIKSLRMAWVCGYTYVGTSNEVVFVTQNATYQGAPYVAGTSSGLIPILSSDTNLGQAYCADIEKHFARKVVKRMWIHVDSLQPSTTNNMMSVFAPRRGGATALTADFVNTGSVHTANTVSNVSSMKGAFSVDSWETKCIEISDYIAGGSGAKQNEFEIGSLTGATTVVAATVDLDGVAPACFALAGNSTTAGLQGTKVHQISIEQEVDLLDFVGGIAQAAPLE